MSSTGDDGARSDALVQWVTVAAKMDGLCNILKSLVLETQASPSEDNLQALTSIVGDFNIALSAYAMPPSATSTPTSGVPDNRPQREVCAVLVHFHYVNIRRWSISPYSQVPNVDSYTIQTAKPNGIRRIRRDAQELDTVEDVHVRAFHLTTGFFEFS